MLKPRPLPPAHKNQLFIPVKSFGFFNDDPTPTTLFRHHEIIRKKLTPRPSGVFTPYTTPAEHDPAAKDLTSSKDTVTSPIHVRGRGSALDVADVTVNVEETPRMMFTSDKDGVKVKVTSFLTEDPTSSRSYDGRSEHFSPVLECSKYNVIGEPRFRKQRAKRSEWKLPQITDASHQVNVMAVPQGNGRHAKAKVNSIDVRSIYGSNSKLLQVPREVKREDTVILPPLEIGTRREEVEASVNAESLAEKRLVAQSLRQSQAYRRLLRDHVSFPAAYRPYFRHRQRQHRYVRTLFNPGDMWENNPVPVHCARCTHQSTATLHYCDVLGKRFCRFCTEMTTRSFSRAYEDNRLLVPSPDKSPTLQMMKEPSFIGVRKVVITKKTARGEGGEEGQGENEGQGQGQGQGQSQGHAQTDVNPVKK